MGDVLDQLLAQILEEEICPTPQVIADPAGDAYSTPIGEAFEPSGNVNAVAENVTVLDHDIADIDADPKPHDGIRLARVGLVHCVLNRDRAVNRVEDADKLSQNAVAGRIGGA